MRDATENFRRQVLRDLIRHRQREAWGVYLTIQFAFGLGVFPPGELAVKYDNLVRDIERWKLEADLADSGET